MGELDTLLEAARRTSKDHRIDHRDAIAAYGVRATGVMGHWINDPELAAFAIRVLERIAQEPAARQPAVEALRSADRSRAPAWIVRDIDDALDRLGVRPSKPPRLGPPTPTEWAGYATASAIEQRFHDDMVGIFRAAGEATRKLRPDGTVIRGYWAQYFLRGVRNHGGLNYAHQLLRKAGTTEGFARLTEERRLDLTMEALVLRPEYDSLFTPGERQTAASRLAAAGYEPDAARRERPNG